MTEHSTSVLERTETTPAPATSDGDHDRFAHYVSKRELSVSAFMGTMMTALCGKKMLSQRDPKRYPVCPTCKERYEQMHPGDPENPDYKAP